MPTPRIWASSSKTIELPKYLSLDLWIERLDAVVVVLLLLLLLLGVLVRGLLLNETRRRRRKSTRTVLAFVVLRDGQRRRRRREVGEVVRACSEMARDNFVGRCGE